LIVEEGHFRSTCAHIKQASSICEHFLKEQCHKTITAVRTAHFNYLPLNLKHMTTGS
jgi:hypothetical protein